MKTYEQLEQDLAFMTAEREAALTSTTLYRGLMDYIKKDRDAQNKELVAAKAELAAIRAVIPEGYLIAKDTLAESVQLMADGLKAYSNERQELLGEIRELQSLQE